MVLRVPVYDARCPKCGAHEREPCISPVTHADLPFYHRERREAAARGG